MRQLRHCAMKAQQMRIADDGVMRFKSNNKAGVDFTAHFIRTVRKFLYSALYISKHE